MYWKERRMRSWGVRAGKEEGMRAVSLEAMLYELA